MKRSDARAQLTDAKESNSLDPQRQSSSSSSSSSSSTFSSQTQSQTGLQITEQTPDQPEVKSSNVGGSTSQTSARSQVELRETAGSSGLARRTEKRKHEELEEEEEAKYRNKKPTPRSSQDLNNLVSSSRKSGSQNHGGRGDADAKVPQLHSSVVHASKNPFVFSSHVVVPDAQKGKKSAQSYLQTAAQSVVPAEPRRQAKSATTTLLQSSNQNHGLGRTGTTASAASVASPGVSSNSARYQRELEMRLTQRAASSSRAQTRTRVERALPTRSSMQETTSVLSRHGFLLNQQQRERVHPSSRNIRGQLTRTLSGEQVRGLIPSESVRSAYSQQRLLLSNPEVSPLLSHSPVANCSSTLLQLPSDGLFPLYPLGQPDELSSAISQFTQDNAYTYQPFLSTAESGSSQDMYPASIPRHRKSSRSSGESSSDIVVPPSSVGIKRAGPYLLGN